MKSAFLQHADGSWVLSWDFDTVLDHSGPMLINESDEDRNENLEVIGAQESKFAAMRHNKVFLTDQPVRANENDAFEDAMRTGSGLCFYSNNLTWVQMPKDAGSIGIVYRTDGSDFDGVVGRKTKDGIFLEMDEPLWERAVVLHARHIRKVQRDLERSIPSRWDFYKVASECSEACGLRTPKSFRFEQLWVWLTACDSACGRRKTNSLALTVARQWCSNREKSKKHFGRYTTPDVVKLTDKRLAAVLRLGDRNSRFKTA